MVRLAPLLLLSGLFLSGVPAGAAHAQTGPSARPSATSYAGPIEESSRRFGIPVAWIVAILQVESAGDPRAVSPKGAMGLMQLMPETWAGLRVRHGLGRDPFDPRDNILAGVAYLREMHDRYGAPGFLAAYNAGPARYEEFLAGRPLPAETRAYLAALAPVVGGELGAAAAVDPNAWRAAPLFVARSERRPDAPRTLRDGPGDERPTAPSTRDQADMAPQSADLFVARTATRGPQ